MAFATTYGKFQQNMKDYYLRTGNRMQFPEMINYMSRNGEMEEYDPTFHNKITADLITLDSASMTDEEFNQVIDGLYLNTPGEIKTSETVVESTIIPQARDVFIIRHPRYTRSALHRHNYFEVDYVANGHATFYFEDTQRELNAGECCIIAPNSTHDLVIDDDSTVFCIMIRKSTFNTTFFSLRSGKDLLSYFFRSILSEDSRANYLLFISKENRELKSLVRGAMIENYRDDPYSNACCISMINLIFANLLRNYSKTLQYYDYSMGSDFTLVLQYIQHNYQTLSLASLAEMFHYSEPHLCTLIKQNTGKNFTSLIKELRMADAMDYLLNTEEKISEIAEMVGYNSADHFSRVFRSMYKMSPLDYRKMHKEDTEAFHPFENI